jgi:hypothetical protein
VATHSKEAIPEEHMAKTQHTHTKDCPDYKAASADRAKHAAAAIQREARLQAAAHSHWMETYSKVK